MNYYGFSIKNVKPYHISNKNVRSCDIYHNDIYLARYVLEPGNGGNAPSAHIYYANEDAREEMQSVVKEVYGNYSQNLVKRMLDRMFDFYEYEYTMKEYQKSGEGKGVMLLSDREDPEKIVALIGLRDTDRKTVKKAKEIYRYMNYGAAFVCTTPDDFVVA